ncbi:EAL domain-containing protein [Roseibium denhamense]|uniref:Diguanylate cyclase (GGDEF) domain-containing protein n=1 Tax=Roseibium denhamense TaxID=76305 RepID=A0ABY1PMW1_9HYPH|nr:EAL domain-containing protein [Roseibium denhamense]MTI04223.1 EAL domain-containing protein [Roseibium denhamense]SMP36867.1 diguanylate cyclase (GGDEF) domain-containing protein [Roseibium denhamense]
MKKIRNFARWMMIDPRHPEIAQAQYNELKFQIPALYALLMVNAIAVSYTHYSAAPFYLTVGVLAPILLFTTYRMLTWISARNVVLGPEDAIRKMRKTVILASLVSVIYITWSLSLDSYGGPAERGHVALFIAITVIGCIFCLMNLPQAAIMVMLIVTIPYLVHYIGQNQDVYIAIAMNIFLVCLVILQVLLSGYAGFCKLIRSQTALAAKQKETELLAAENERLAQTDALTDLPNRRYFFARVDKHIEDVKETRAAFAVGVVDLDRFKPINDTHGHQLGDQLLAAVGDRLKQLMGPDLHICRLGGDEFGFLFTGDPEEAEAVGQKICDAVRQPYKVGDLQVTIGASCGIAFYPDGGTNSHVLFDHSDYALYTAKTTHRGSVTLYSHEHENQIRSDRAIESALQHADMDAEFEVHFQPIMALPEQKIIGFEALARWDSPVLGRVSPDMFIPIAERTGLMQPLTLCLFNKAVRQIMALPGSLRLSFNLSAQDVSSIATVVELIAAIKQHGIDARRITVEITETSVIGCYDAAAVSFAMLREAGIRIALDDFGTGYSSLGYLHRLPIDCVKIDRSFVASIDDTVARGVITSIMDLCRSMNLVCVIEGIETADQVAVLESLDCRFGQGYFFCKPMPFDALAASANETGLVEGYAFSSQADTTILLHASR